MVQLESYKLISDSLMLFGNGYVEIKKLTEDTLVLYDPCSGNVNIYGAVEFDKRIR